MDAAVLAGNALPPPWQSSATHFPFCVCLTESSLLVSESRLPLSLLCSVTGGETSCSSSPVAQLVRVTAPTSPPDPCWFHWQLHDQLAPLWVPRLASGKPHSTRVDPRTTGLGWMKRGGSTPWLVLACSNSCMVLGSPGRPAEMGSSGPPLHLEKFSRTTVKGTLQDETGQLSSKKVVGCRIEHHITTMVKKRTSLAPQCRNVPGFQKASPKRLGGRSVCNYFWGRSK